MLGSFTRRRYPFLALAAILIVALTLLLIARAHGISLLQPGTPAWEHGTTGAGYSVADLSSGVASGETDVPRSLRAGSGYQAIDSSQTTGGYTTGSHTTGSQNPSGQPTTGQNTVGETTGDPPIGGQVPGGQVPDDQPIGSGTTGGQTSEGIATPELPSSLLVVLGLILLLGVGWLNARRRYGLDRR